MTATLNHSPADIIRELLIDLSMGTDPVPINTWPVYEGTLPDTPDNAICVYNTEGRQFGKSQIDGEVFEHYGIQVLVRSMVETTGFVKAQAVKDAFNKSVKRTSVTIGSSIYLVHGVHTQGNVRRAGREGNRYMHAVSAITSITMTTG